ncbi:MAG: hypothetical protein PGN29_18570, partial [Gordonia paraffinivorans]
IIPTQVLADAIVEHKVPTFVSASATGFYGFTGDDERTESSPRGSGFLADLSADWERTASLATSARVGPPADTAPVFSSAPEVCSVRSGRCSRPVSAPSSATGSSGSRGSRSPITSGPSSTC